MREITRAEAVARRLAAHHLTAPLSGEGAVEQALPLGVQDSPPGMGEAALFCRVGDLAPGWVEEAVASGTLCRCWSFRGAPYLFPAAQRGLFLGALCAREGEEWIYAYPGFAPVAARLGLGADRLLPLLCQAAEELPGPVTGKAELDRQLADWLAPRLPGDVGERWESPSLYGPNQRLGEAAVSFLLRACALQGHLVLGPRRGRSPLFWPGDWGRKRLPPADSTLLGEGGQRELTLRFLALYGPATEGEFAAFLGCCPRQGKRLWALAKQVGEPVSFLGRPALALAAGDCPSPPRGVQLLPPYDPYLYGGRRWLCEEGLAGQLWKTVGNPGALLRDGVAVGWWRGKASGKNWSVQLKGSPLSPGEREGTAAWLERYAAFRGLRLKAVEWPT